MKRRRFLTLSAGLAALVPAAAGAAAGTAGGRRSAQARDGRFAAVAALVETKMADYGVPGVAVGLQADGDVTLRAFGVRNAEDRQPLTTDTVMTIASISKTMTATAVARLVEAGRLAFDAPVRTYLPEFRIADEETSRTVTLAHLLTHTPGWEGQLSSDDRGIEALAHFVSVVMRDLPALARPGAVWSYNNAGFSLAGRVLEVVTGRSVHDALRDLIFLPLALSRTFTRLADAATYPLSVGHREENGRTVVVRPYQSTSGTTAGGVMTSLADLMRYAALHLGDGRTPDGRPFLTRATLAELQRAHVAKHGTEDSMGLGWHLRSVGGLTTAAHGGTLNGHCLHLQLVPERQLAFAILTNHVNGWRLIQDVEHDILQRYARVRLRPNQRIGHRGVNEAMSFHSSPLTPQPEERVLADYVGPYRRPPVGALEVRREGRQLLVTGGGPQTTLAFYGPDAAYATSGAYLGSPFEFIRRPDGKVGWIRNNGRVAARAT